MFRIKELREAKGLNMKETAGLLNMPYTTYVNYEKELREPTSEVLIQLADFYDTTVDFIVGRSSSATVPSGLHLPATPSSLALNIEETTLIRKYRCLDDRGRAAVLNVLNHEYESLPGEKADSPAKNA